MAKKLTRKIKIKARHGKIPWKIGKLFEKPNGSDGKKARTLLG